MPNFKNENIKLAKELRGSLQHSDIRVGWLGKITATGVVNPNPMDGLSFPYIWVRFEQNGEAVRAVNMRVDSRLANVRVRVGRDRNTGEIEILGLATEAAAELGEIAGTMNVPSRISDLITELVDPLRIKPLRVRPGSAAFDVYVEGGYYWHNGIMKAWAGDFINIAASVPGGINTKRPVLIGIDPATDTLTSYNGDVIPMGTAPMRGKYFTQAVIAETVNDAGSNIFWIACIPITINDTDWRDVLRVTALQFTFNATPANAGHGILVNDVLLAQRSNLNFLDGNGINIAGVDDPTNDESEIAFTVNQGEIDLGNLGNRSINDLSDVIITTPSAGQILKFNGTNWQNVPPTFTLLTDTPGSYAGQALKHLRVNAAANAVEFVTPAFTLLSDVPSSYAGQALKGLRVNAGETGVEFHDYTGDFVAKTGDTMTGDLLISTTSYFPFISNNSFTMSVNDAFNRSPIIGVVTLDQNGNNATGLPGASGTFGRTIVSGASGTVSSAAGAYGQVQKTGNGTLTVGASLFADTITKTGAGTFTNAVGLYLAAQTVGTNNYGIFQSGAGLNRFNDQVNIVGSANRVQLQATPFSGQSADFVSLAVPFETSFAMNNKGYVTINYGASTPNGDQPFKVNFSGTQILALTHSANILFGIAAGTEIQQATTAGGARSSFKITSRPHTTMTFSTERNEVLWDFSATQQFATGAIGDQRTVWIKAPTYSFVGASTITNAVTFEISGPPQTGTNATFTNAFAFKIASGKSKFGGNIVLSAVNIETDTTTGTMIGTGPTQKISLFGKTPIVQPTALTTQLTTVTFTAPGAPDYAIQDFVDVSLGAGWAFANHDEANSLLKAFANVQIRLSELETHLSNFGFLP